MFIFGANLAERPLRELIFVVCNSFDVSNFVLNNLVLLLAKFGQNQDRVLQRIFLHIIGDAALPLLRLLRPFINLINMQFIGIAILAGEIQRLFLLWGYDFLVWRSRILRVMNLFLRCLHRGELLAQIMERSSLTTAVQQVVLLLDSALQRLLRAHRPPEVFHIQILILQILFLVHPFDVESLVKLLIATFLIKGFLLASQKVDICFSIFAIGNKLNIRHFILGLHPLDEVLTHKLFLGNLNDIYLLFITLHVKSELMLRQVHL